MTGLRIIVCAKQVPDPEAPASAVDVDPEKRRVTVKGLMPVINPLDEVALEAALQIKEKYGGKVTVLSVGERLSENVLRKVLAAGADELILVQDEGLDDLDPYSTALLLFKAIEKLGTFDLILTGRESADWGSGQVGLMLAELLGIPAINWVKRIEVVNGAIRAAKVVHGGYDLVEAPLPALLTVTNEFGELRYVSIMALKRARDKPVDAWTLSDVDVDPSTLRKMEVAELFKPRFERMCTIITGKTPEEVGERLAVKLVEELHSLRGR
ncbi:MAG: electron transfer flavoprotein subunit beta/FixA family protein [Candidatus Nezhaarchaeota archaeon]|nr:electron transfer flavoprotein subunit beta/FixA family protein [Candidatus Nezhaarchaeota archaeon]